ncbi:J domain-containing protein [Chroococcidiopsis thermalis]|uniref:Uncharacterized protein n=1 Tax=Chroococcidiopsis thermalis (strain PCC 7203) TaxID=251229 RepID=K9TVA1_CHRTP|nr:J domain-containing protein [Chroococcidiopsis thermalis]AFY85929.1 hypothetical protein Chro_0377 [Chroococcidiopsis thermalis PCC 7203]PSB46701.1 hypothetical protein C7B80_12610 [Cyanosarcina cf. burmensis CCALA 770]
MLRNPWASTRGNFGASQAGLSGLSYGFPDRFSHNPRLQEKAQEELKKINEAYEVLKSSTFSASANTHSSSSASSTDERSDSQKTRQSNSY